MGLKIWFRTSSHVMPVLHYENAALTAETRETRVVHGVSLLARRD
jgi:hypothetical protein